MVNSAALPWDVRLMRTTKSRLTPSCGGRGNRNRRVMRRVPKFSGPAVEQPCIARMAAQWSWALTPGDRRIASGNPRSRWPHAMHMIGEARRGEVLRGVVWRGEARCGAHVSRETPALPQSADLVVTCLGRDAFDRDRTPRRWIGEPLERTTLCRSRGARMGIAVSPTPTRLSVGHRVLPSMAHGSRRTKAGVY